MEKKKKNLPRSWDLHYLQFFDLRIFGDSKYAKIIKFKVAQLWKIAMIFENAFSTYYSKSLAQKHNVFTKNDAILSQS